MLSHLSDTVDNPSQPEFQCTLATQTNEKEQKQQLFFNTKFNSIRKAKSENKQKQRKCISKFTSRKPITEDLVSNQLKDRPKHHENIPI